MVLLRRIWPQHKEVEEADMEQAGEAEEEDSPLSTQSLSGWLLSPWIHIAGQLKKKHITQAD